MNIQRQTRNPYGRAGAIAALTGVLILLASCPTPFKEATLAQMQDLEAPVITLTSPEELGEYGTVLLLAGTVSDGGNVGAAAMETLDPAVSFVVEGTALSGTVDLEADGSFSHAVDMSAVDGQRLVTVTASDKNGNEATVSVQIVKPTDGGNVPGFSVTPGNKQANLSWDPVPMAESYTVTEWSYGNEQSGITETSYVWTDLKNGEEYIFTVTAVFPDGTGTDAQSAMIEVVPLGIRMLTPWITEIGYGSVTLAWQPGYTMIDRYKVERSTAPDGPWETRQILTESTYTDYGLYADTTYYYRVSPADGVGGLAAAGEPVSVVASPFLPGADTTVSMPGEVHASIINGNYVYSVGESNGSGNKLTVTDISFPSSASIDRTIDLDGTESSHPANDLVIYGDYLYVTQGEDGIAIFDITNPRIPDPIGSYDIAANNDTFALWVDGSELYVAAGSWGLRILSLADPENLTELGHISAPDIPDAMDVAVEDGFAYVTSADSIYKIDVSDPANPEVTTSGPGAAPCCDAGMGSPRLQLYNGYLFVSGDWSGWDGSGGRTWACSTDTLMPSPPDRPVNDADPVDVPVDMPIFDRIGYLLHGNGIDMYDVTDPMNPQSEGSISGVAQVSDLDIAGSLQVISTFSPFGGTSGSLVIRETANPDAPALRTTMPFGGDVVAVSAIDVEGDYAYLLTEHEGDSTGRLAVVDVSDPENPGTPVFTTTGFPRIVQWYEGYVRDIAVQGDYAYIADPEADLIVVDVSDPTAPGDPIYLSVPGEIHALYLSGEYAYVAGTRFSVIDISDPTTPTLLDTTYLTRTLRVYDMTRYGDTLYLAGEGALVSFDVSDLENPTSETLVKEFSSIDSYSAAVGGDYLYYLYEDTNDFHGYRLTDGEPSNINIASHNPLDIAVAGDYALVATYQDNTTDLSELVVVDISTFQSEAVVGTPISMSGKVLHDIDVQGSWVFGAYSDQDYQDGGLVIFNLNGTE